MSIAYDMQVGGNLGIGAQGGSNRWRVPNLAMYDNRMRSSKRGKSQNQQLASWRVGVYAHIRNLEDPPAPLSAATGIHDRWSTGALLTTWKIWEHLDEKAWIASLQIDVQPWK
ncbi:hypothetical protein B0H34DRAFT_816846 [Crassisporium funariophilum]|nr:hypothetical protein B0H34DRAFT_816846 [Crassisporium funariophilum]